MNGSLTERHSGKSMIPDLSPIRMFAMNSRDARDESTPLLLCHSHLRWDWVYQRPQHLLTRLARHWPVIVEEEPVFDGRPPGLDVLRVAEGVTVLRPHRQAEADHDLGGM